MTDADQDTGARPKVGDGWNSAGWTEAARSITTIESGRQTAARTAAGNRLPTVQNGSNDANAAAAKQPIPNLANALIAMRDDPTINNAFAYDEMFCGPVLTRPLNGEKDDRDFSFRPVTDVDAAELQEWLQINGL